MPMYTYQTINKDGSDGELFEVFRRMSDPPLTHHPENGLPVRRVFQPIHIAGITNEIHKKTLLNEKNLDKSGFTMYKKNGKGHYERRAGSGGPETLSAD